MGSYLSTSTLSSSNLMPAVPRDADVQSFVDADQNTTAVVGVTSTRPLGEEEDAGTTRMSVDSGGASVSSVEKVCLHQNPNTAECLKQHQEATEMSLAIARSKDKTCGICLDTIMEKRGLEKRFGILSNCKHSFCINCILKWRHVRELKRNITTSCPECRVRSDFVCPSAFWVETKEDKEKLFYNFRSELATKDCKFFKKGTGYCPYGSKCLYKHALPNGELVNLGTPMTELLRNVDSLRQEITETFAQYRRRH